MIVFGGAGVVVRTLIYGGVAYEWRADENVIGWFSSGGAEPSVAIVHRAMILVRDYRRCRRREWWQVGQ